MKKKGKLKEKDKYEEEILAILSNFKIIIVLKEKDLEKRIMETLETRKEIFAITNKFQGQETD